MRIWGTWLALCVLAACSANDASSGRANSGTGGSGSGSGAGASSGSGTGGTSSATGLGAGTGTGGRAGTASGTGGSGARGMTDGGMAQQCNPTGSTRSCCVSGKQTCEGTGEFGIWGPCLDSSGGAVMCSDGCSAGEFGPKCEKPDSGTSCAPGEFGPGCDAGPPPPPPPPPPLCTDPTVSNEPEILVGYSPAMGETVKENGQIKVWVTDERAPIISANEQVDMTTGMITMPGDRTATAPDGYLWEPALYIAPQTAETGGTPHFPQFVKGWYNNVPPVGGARPPAGAGAQVPGMDPPPAGTQLLMYTTEYIWDVNSLGLAPGTYSAEFVIHDGDRDRAVGCINITITGLN